MRGVTTLGFDWTSEETPDLVEVNPTAMVIQ